MSKLRIAIITEGFVPNISGVAVFAEQLARGLVAAGHTVIVCAPSPTGKPYVEEGASFPVYRIRSVRNPWRKNFRLVVRQQKTLSRILTSFNPDIIHAQDPGGCSIAAMKYARKRRIPVVGTYHFSLQFIAAYVPFAKLLSNNLKPFIRAYCNDFFNQCTIITCPTETVRKDIATSGLRPPIRVISNGVDTASPLSQIKRSLATWENPTLLYVGRVDEDKNLPMLLRAMPYIIAQKDVKLRIVGDGNELSSYKRWVRNHGLEERILFVGALPPRGEALTREYAQAAVFLMPCLVETQSIVTMEAMVAALPVVAPHAGALPELIQHGSTGYLVDQPNAQRFASAVVTLLDEPQTALQFGLKGREAIQIHSLTQSLDHFVDLYREMIMAGPTKQPLVLRAIKKVTRALH